MREPVSRRTPFGHVPASARQGAFGFIGALSLCATISLALLGAAPVQAQAVADPQIRYSIESRKASSSLLLDVARAGDRLVAVGDRGHVLYSDDEGRNWTQAKVPTRQMLTAIYFIDASHGWAVGHDALILATRDGGQSWTVQYEEREREAPLLDVWFGDTRHGLAVGAYGALLETTDGGQNWEDVSDRLDNEDGFHLNAIAQVGENGLFIVGEMGGIFRSRDRGQSWEALESPYDGSFFGVLGGNDPEVVLAYGLRGHLFRSTDFGDSWQQIRLQNGGGNPLEAGLADGNRLADGRVVIVGHGGSVLTSADQGRTFTYHSRPDRLSLAGVIADKQGNLVLVGQGGVRLATPTGAELAQQQ